MNTTRCSPAAGGRQRAVCFAVRPSAGQSASRASLRISAVSAVAISGQVDAGRGGRRSRRGLALAVDAGAAGVDEGACARTAAALP